jgi:hypothetical protein
VRHLNVLAQVGIGVVTGVAAHQTDKPLTSVFGDEEIGYLAHCTTGVLVGMLLFSLFNRQRHEHTADTNLVDLILAFCSLALGVLIGRVVDNARGKR